MKVTVAITPDAEAYARALSYIDEQGHGFAVCIGVTSDRLRAQGDLGSVALLAEELRNSSDAVHVMADKETYFVPPEHFEDGSVLEIYLHLGRLKYRVTAG